LAEYVPGTLHARHARPEEDSRDRATGSTRHRAGEDRCEALADRLRRPGDVLLNKHRFDVFTNENVPTVLDVLAPDDIVLYGVATDVCDRAAVEGLLEHRPHTRLFVVTDA